MTTQLQRITLEQWDRRYARLRAAGLCESDYGGPLGRHVEDGDSRLEKLSLKLLAPNLPGDTMVMQGQVADLEASDHGQRVGVDFAGRNGLGFHVTGAATLRVG